MEDKNKILSTAPGNPVDNSPDAQALREAQKPDPLHDYGDEQTSVLPVHTDLSLVSSDEPVVDHPVTDEPVVEQVPAVDPVVTPRPFDQEG